MNKNPIARLALGLFALSNCTAQAEATVSNLRAAQQTGTRLVQIDYDLTGTTLPSFVSVVGSSDGGATWALPMTALSGKVGSGIAPGRNQRITWNAGVDWNGQVSNLVKFRVSALDSAPISFVIIPAGSFQMGADAAEASSDEQPIHSVYVSAFSIQNTETTQALWKEVRDWGLGNGYTDISEGFGVAANHPVQNVSWYCVVKWCNARSQMEGLPPCYKIGGSIYKTGDAVPVCDFRAGGYRLPTEAEWEKAARGGYSNNRFPWGNTITHSDANYESNPSFIYDISPTRGKHPVFSLIPWVYTSPVGSFAANGYGLYDMSGNVWEMCWDRYSSTYYSAVNNTSDPTGPATGINRVSRGGAWCCYADKARCADRDAFLRPYEFSYYDGFRCVR